MSSAAPRKLTERQRAVIERIHRRVPIKVIAQELGVSETRIKQHIRALKDIYRAESLNELVEEYRIRKPGAASGEHLEGTVEATKNPEDTGLDKGFNEASYSKNQVFSGEDSEETHERVDRGELVMGDALPLIEQAPWLRPGRATEPKVVPGVLEGEHAVLLRLAAIAGIGFGFLGALVLTVTAADTISEALDGRATVPADQTVPS